jgi:hypothetical protein
MILRMVLAFLTLSLVFWGVAHFLTPQLVKEHGMTVLKIVGTFIFTGLFMFFIVQLF